MLSSRSLPLPVYLSSSAYCLYLCASCSRSLYFSCASPFLSLFLSTSSPFSPVYVCLCLSCFLSRSRFLSLPLLLSVSRPSPASYPRHNSFRHILSPPAKPLLLPRLAPPIRLASQSLPFQMDELRKAAAELQHLRAHFAEVSPPEALACRQQTLAQRREAVLTLSQALSGTVDEG